MDSLERKTDENERAHSFANVISTVDGAPRRGTEGRPDQRAQPYAFECGQLKQDKKESFHPKDIWRD